ncbi:MULTISPECIES: hypothetical protein [unclassified Paenibacillus]|uniref:hypothetical protein n=1 Tax=unclassified Paenibacillus TaxID=185978 RepID=UPI0009542D63|nr:MULTISPECIES: hypothetical protein [unclassified Paenibacillus]ASS67099.1 hypothetical protein CIC07_13845 [Paenibacillus sp. RUD330]SIQ90220.1 hypothetical protein SAMN05880555_2665 [Paenibacillus sp. RU4X]SIR11071.1 hypothetical protein SAMN05880570_2665 [Paenibacillus sp. RU4T]
MLVGDAWKLADEWVRKQAAPGEGFVGAYLGGSTASMPEKAELPAGSDVDVFVVLEGEAAPPKLGKFLYGGALLEVTYLPWSGLDSVEKVLGSYHLAGGIRNGRMSADPSGRLGAIQREAVRCFPERFWVERRCRDALQRMKDGLSRTEPDLPWHDRVTAWLFPTGVAAHVILTAALRNPTIRLRYLAARGVLEEYGLSGCYDELLQQLGSAKLRQARVEHHLAGLSRTFDAAASAARTPFFFSSDITPEARPIAIQASLELIRSGNHREAAFWIAATYARCRKILAADAPELLKPLAPDFDELMEDLGIRSQADLERRAQRTLAYLPRLEEIAAAIMERNPDIAGSTRA